MTPGRWFPVAAAAFALGSGGFVYADTVPTGMHKADDKSVIVQPLNVTIEDLEDMEIYGPNGEEVGEVEAVLVDASAQPVAIAADVGGFLGMGEKDVVIALDRLTQDGDHLKIDMTKEQIGALPDFED
jgi:sporulation protein YlmC with PRC-barrel domain